MGFSVVLTCQIFLPPSGHFLDWCMHPKSLGQALQPEIVCTVLSISTKALSMISQVRWLFWLFLFSMYTYKLQIQIYSFLSLVNLICMTLRLYLLERKLQLYKSIINTEVTLYRGDKIHWLQITSSSKSRPTCLQQKLKMNFLIFATCMKPSGQLQQPSLVAHRQPETSWSKQVTDTGCQRDSKKKYFDQ